MSKKILGLMLTQTRLREMLEYDPDTGVFRWRKGGPGRYYPGRIAGATNAGGYRVIAFDGERLRAARLAWLYMTGKWPEEHVDHINGNPADDRWANLREATRAENLHNVGLRPNNTSGVRGVSWNKRQQQWHARVNFNGTLFHCGYFDTLDEAKAARDAKAFSLAGEFARFDSIPKGTLQ